MRNQIIWKEENFFEKEAPYRSLKLTLLKKKIFFKNNLKFFKFYFFFKFLSFFKFYFYKNVRLYNYLISPFKKNKFNLFKNIKKNKFGNNFIFFEANKENILPDDKHLYKNITLFKSLDIKFFNNSVYNDLIVVEFFIFLINLFFSSKS